MRFGISKSGTESVKRKYSRSLFYHTRILGQKTFIEIDKIQL